MYVSYYVHDMELAVVIADVILVMRNSTLIEQVEFSGDISVFTSEYSKTLLYASGITDTYADPQNEHQIQKAFDGLIKNKTVIMVAHRLSTVQDADQILVMKNGAIAESGTHSDLIKHQGEYAKMWDNYNKTVQWHIES